jgi:ABC-type lipoprotein export system ATPase subunit
VLSKGYRAGVTVVDVLEGVDRDVVLESWSCVLAPSGSGRTTFLGRAGGVSTAVGGHGAPFDPLSSMGANECPCDYFLCRPAELIVGSV